MKSRDVSAPALFPPRGMRGSVEHGKHAEVVGVLKALASASKSVTCKYDASVARD